MREMKRMNHMTPTERALQDKVNEIVGWINAQIANRERARRGLDGMEAPEDSPSPPGRPHDGGTEDLRRDERTEEILEKMGECVRAHEGGMIRGMHSHSFPCGDREVSIALVPYRGRGEGFDVEVRIYPRW